MRRKMRHSTWSILFTILLTLSFVWMVKQPGTSVYAIGGSPAIRQQPQSQQKAFHTAVSCSGSGCNHQDPYATGCAASMYSVATAYLNAGTKTGRVELEYSRVCQTNWDQVYSGNGVEYHSACLARNAGLDGPEAQDCYTSTRFAWIDTNMLWSPRNLDDANGCFVDLCRGGPSGQISGYFSETGYY